MNTQHKPADYNTVSPYLIVDGAAETLDFLKRVFDAVELRRFPDDSGKLMHAEVRIDDTVIMLADPAPPDWRVTPSHVHIYVRDVDATYPHGARRRRDFGAGADPEAGRRQTRRGEGCGWHDRVDRHQSWVERRACIFLRVSTPLRRTFSSAMQSSLPSS